MAFPKKGLSNYTITFFVVLYKFRILGNELTNNDTSILSGIERYEEP